MLTRLKVKYIPEITYKDIVGWNPIHLRMDVLLPKTSKPTPCIVFLSGGGFLVCPKSNCLQLRLHLAEAGFMVASVEYRTGGVGTFIEALKDIKTAIKFIKLNASYYNIDKNKMAIMGESAGGYLSLMTALTGEEEFCPTEYISESCRVQAVVDLYGPTDLYSSRIAESIFFKGIPPYFEVPADVYEQASPYKYLDKLQLPAFLLVHGRNDRVVPVDDTYNMFKAMNCKGIRVEKIIVDNAGHGSDCWCQDTVILDISHFLKGKLDEYV